MNPRFLLFSFLIVTAAATGIAFSTGTSGLPAQIEGLDARQALALANQWGLENQPVKSHITASQVVFEFDNGIKRSVALPEDEMMVAVAPYIDRTHQ